MKNNKVLFGMVMLIVAFSLMARSATAQAAALSLINLQISPAPVVAGDNITVYFQLFNSYSQSLSQVNLQLEAQNPIINISPSYDYYGYTIGTGLYGGFGFNGFTYKLHIPSTLPAGEYTIDVVANYQTSEGTSSGTAVAAQSIIPIYIYVYGNPQISLNIVPEGQITPGKDFTATITAVNSGTDTARNVTMQILSTNSFAPDGPSTFQLGIIPSEGSSAATATIFTYQNISGGMNYLQALLTYTTQEGIPKNEIANVPINILLNNPDIVGSITGATPQQLYPGSNQSATVLVQNIGTGEAYNLTLEFLSGNGISASGAAASFFVGSLAAGAEVSENVFISANADVNQSGAKLPMRANYQYVNHQGNITTVQYIPVNLQSSAVFSITSVNPAVPVGAAYKPVTFTVKNIGNEEATGISFSLQSIYPVTPATPDYYLASLAPGQAANVTFYVNVDSQGRNGQYPITLYAQWRQPNGATNQQYSGSDNYYINVGSQQGGYGGIIAAAIVIAVIMIVLGVLRKKGRLPIGAMRKKVIPSKQKR